MISETRFTVDTSYRLCFYFHCRCSYPPVAVIRLMGAVTFYNRQTLYNFLAFNFVFVELGVQRHPVSNCTLRFIASKTIVNNLFSLTLRALRWNYSKCFFNKSGQLFFQHSSLSVGYSFGYLTKSVEINDWCFVKNEFLFSLIYSRKDDRIMEKRLT